MYDSTCPFHRNSWNCIKNQRENMGRINSWKWVPESCDLNRVDPAGFLNLMRNKNIGFVGDSLNENFLVSFLCILRVADAGAKKWKRKGAWRGAYFPKFNVTVGYHRAVLLAKYEWQTKQPELAGQNGVKGIYRVDVDIPADDWANIADFYSVLVFNTGHWWGYDKFPKETPLVFFKGGRPIHPPLEMSDGLKVVVQNMVAHIEKVFPKRYSSSGGYSHQGTFMVASGIRTEVACLISLLKKFRADAHPATWLGKKDAVAVWGQDCMHWCLPGVPDTWVDILTQLITYNLEMG
ncbi:UNVERIFIED_CONTAM: protein trichome birefringence-like 12 [Sesamum latifolium]|uniref:Protein trichome birefringence-like 12 n=1 Tax=Sesamum latifolium TaxID=2727402 RepID=A0AAW2UZH1_9LAMI